MREKVKDISKQVVVITGASSGIGKLTSLRLASLGARVVISSRSEASLNLLETEIKALGTSYPRVE